MFDHDVLKIIIIEGNQDNLTPKGALFRKLLMRLPEKYWDLVYEFYEDDGLIDGCKYIVSFNDGHSWNGYESIPVRSITEAVKFIREAK